VTCFRFTSIMTTANGTKLRSRIAQAEKRV